MAKTSVLYFDPVSPEYKQIIENEKPKNFDVWYWHELNETEKAVKLESANYFLVMAAKIKDEMISSAKHLKHIQRTGVGYENIDVKAADRNGITVSKLPDVNGIAVAEHTVLLALAILRRLVDVNADTKAGNWPIWKYRPTSFELDGKTHGVLGFGYIGRETARRSKAFGTKIIYYDLVRASKEVEMELNAEYMTKDEVIANSDILSVHVPLTKDSVDYINSNELNKMKRNAILINVARGGVVNEAALYDALKNGTIAGAGIDTWVDEPCPGTNPLLGLQNVIATAHVAAGTIDTYAKQIRGSFDNILLAEATGKPNNCVGSIKEMKEKN